MPKRKRNLLTDAEIRAATSGTLNDGAGLILRVARGGSKSWQVRYTADGERHTVSLGGYPTVSLADARKAATRVRDGGALADAPDPEPVAAPAPIPRYSPDPRNPAFWRVAHATVDELRQGWTGDRAKTVKREKHWRNMLEKYAFPVIGDKPCAEITSPDIIKILRPIWTTKEETATRLKQRMSAVFDYAQGEGFCSHNPVPHKIKGIARQTRQRKHYRALPYTEVPAAVDKIAACSRRYSSRVGLLFLILTATRSGDVCGARWREIDLENQVWTIPAERHKLRRPFRVPLTEMAIEMLGDAGEPDSLIFPGQARDRHGNRKELSDMAFSELLRGLEIDCVPHGFRSSFKDWCIETGVDWQVAERALSHTLGNSVAASYARTDLFEQRRELMERWAAFTGLAY